MSVLMDNSLRLFRLGGGHKWFDQSWGPKAPLLVERWQYYLRLCNANAEDVRIHCYGFIVLFSFYVY